METEVSLQEDLWEIRQASPKTIANLVAREAMEYGAEPRKFFKDLQRSGCLSGMVSSLTYYHQTHEFYDRHYDEIEEMRVEYEETMGVPLKIQGDLKNFLAWFAFVEVAWQLAIKLDLRI